MSAFHSYELLDPNYYRDPGVSNQAFSSPILSSSAYAFESMEDHLNLRISVAYPNPILIFSIRRPEELCLRCCFGDRLTDADLISTSTQETKSKSIYERKSANMDRKYKCGAKAKGTFERSMMRWNQMHMHNEASVPAKDVCEAAKELKEVERAIIRLLDDGTNPPSRSITQGLAKRSAPSSSKGKRKEISPQEAAMAIQKTFRDHMSRRTRAFRSLRNLAAARLRLMEIRASISKFSYRRRISKDVEERRSFLKKVAVLLLNVDAIEAGDLMARSSKRSMIRELEALLRQLAAESMLDSSLSFSADRLLLAYGVADVVRMLDREEEDEEDGHGIEDAALLPDLFC